MNCIDLEKIDNGWRSIIEEIPVNIRNKVDISVKESVDTYEPGLSILPPKELRLASMSFFKPSETKVVIIGQDPYIQQNQPMGLSFSVPRGVTVPPSLKNIYKELETDIDGFRAPGHGDLTYWAQQGVLLLNASLTVVERLSNSHKAIWREFIPRFLEIFSAQNPGVIYMLWGNDAKAMKQYIRGGTFIEGAHPSPLARGAFFGGKYFSRANSLLEGMGKSPIDWKLKD